MNGQSAISISDIPFWYSIINLAVIWHTGELGDPTRFYVIGLMSGLIGTFFVFWHPIQWILDVLILHTKRITDYKIENPEQKPDKVTIKIDKNTINRSLKTSAITYQKDKFASFVYFAIIFFTFVLALQDKDVQEVFSSEIPESFEILFLVILSIGIGVGYLTNSFAVELVKNVKLTGLFLMTTNKIAPGQVWLNEIKTAIDLKDWIIVKDTIERQLRTIWVTVVSYDEKDESKELI